jgi:non-heme chloroperoxidase
MQHAAPPPRFATSRLATGPQVHYAEQGDPGGEPILFLPAYADSWFSYSRVLALLPTRYHAFAVDQRGHGDSERPACCYTVDDFTADTVAFLDAIGLQRATLVGHSGSCFTARWGGGDPPRAGRPAGAQRLPSRVAARAGGGMVAGDHGRPSRPGAGGLHPRVPGRRRPRPPARGVPGAAGCRERQAAGPRVAGRCRWPGHLRRRRRSGADRGADAAGVGRPRRAVATQEQQRLAATIPGARSRVYPETGHSPHWERPERFAADLDAFMRTG